MAPPESPVPAPRAVYGTSSLLHALMTSLTSLEDSGNTTVKTIQFAWPLTLSYSFSANSDGSFQQYTTLNQVSRKDVMVQLNGNPVYSSSFSDSVSPRDLLFVDSGGNSSAQHQVSSETYQYSNSKGACWNETITANGGTLTSVQGGSCMHRQKATIPVR